MQIRFAIPAETGIDQQPFSSSLPFSSLRPYDTFTDIAKGANRFVKRLNGWRMRK
jgi:hypothetical protein